MDDDHKELMTEAVNIYRGIAPDLNTNDLDEAAEYIGERLYEMYWPEDRDYFGIAREALKEYF